ncbi:MAG: hypothetical protein K0Q63_2172 [Paenibacillus sp.]|jgi:hypothetical protein|nr:hypothetical protein [Paenibacillus sp.]
MRKGDPRCFALRLAEVTVIPEYVFLKLCSLHFRDVTLRLLRQLG